MADHEEKIHINPAFLRNGASKSAKIHINPGFIPTHKLQKFLGASSNYDLGFNRQSTTSNSSSNGIHKSNTYQSWQNPNLQANFGVTYKSVATKADVSSDSRLKQVNYKTNLLITSAPQYAEKKLYDPCKKYNSFYKKVNTGHVARSHTIEPSLKYPIDPKFGSNGFNIKLKTESDMVSDQKRNFQIACRNGTKVISKLIGSDASLSDVSNIVPKNRIVSTGNVVALDKNIPKSLCNSGNPTCCREPNNPAMDRVSISDDPKAVQNGPIEVISRNKFIRKLCNPPPQQSYSKYAMNTRTKLIKKPFYQTASYSNEPVKHSKLACSSIKPISSKKDLAKSASETFKLCSSNKFIKSSLFTKKKFESKYMIITNNKLIRNTSNSNNVINDKFNIPSYVYKTKTKLINHKYIHNSPVIKMTVNHNIKRKSPFSKGNESATTSLDNNSCTMNKLNAVMVTTTPKYHIKTRTKLVKSQRISRRSTESPKLSPRTRKFNGSAFYIIKTRTKLVKSKHITTNKNITLSRSVATSKLQHQKSFPTHPRATKKNFRIVNIGGRCYKSTQTSLKRHSFNNIPAGPCRSGEYSKNGIKRQKSMDDLKQHLRPGDLIEIVRRRKLGLLKKRNEFCLFYRKHGKCTRKDKGLCPFIHDPDKVAVCTRFLQGTCNVENCLFSHQLDKSKMPVCSHFLEGTCARENCPYRHVNVNPAAPICSNFLKGFCTEGEECKKKHILVCQEFQVKGSCPRGKNCPLSHRVTQKKGTLKKKSSVNAGKLRKSKGYSVKKCSQGILGMTVEEVTKQHNHEGKKHYRYFDGSPPKEGSKYTGKVNNCIDSGNVALSNSEGEKSAAKSHINEIEAKRSRLLMKVEKLKENYTTGLDSDALSVSMGSNTQSSLNSPPLNTNSIPERFTKLFLPLPHVLPDFIPLPISDDEM